MEIWKDIEDFEGYYQVSNEGRIKRIFYKKSNSNKLLKPFYVKNGKSYGIVRLSKNCKPLTLYIHRLVGKAFIPNPLNLPEINHKDNNRQNNNSWNLEWVTPKENIQHCIKQGREYRAKGEKCNLSKLTEQQVFMIRKRINNKEISQNKLAKELNISQPNISSIMLRKTWK